MELEPGAADIGSRCPFGFLPLMVRGGDSIVCPPPVDGLLTFELRSTMIDLVRGIPPPPAVPPTSI